MKLLQNLSSFESSEEKYEYLVELGSALPKLSNDQKTNENRIIGCQNRVWLCFEEVEDRLIIKGESDSRLVSGLIAILIDIYSSKSKQQIIGLGENFLNDSYLSLSMTRIKGLNSIIRRIVQAANLVT